MPDTRPQPVTSAGNIAGAVSGIVTALGTVAVVLGVLTQTDADTLLTAVTSIIGGIVTVVTVLAPILKARQARDAVTPLSDPRTVDGTALVPVAPPPVVLDEAKGDRGYGAIELLVIVILIVLLILLVLRFA